MTKRLDESEARFQETLHDVITTAIDEIVEKIKGDKQDMPTWIKKLYAGLRGFPVHHCWLCGDFFYMPFEKWFVVRLDNTLSFSCGKPRCIRETQKVNFANRKK